MVLATQVDNAWQINNLIEGTIHGLGYDGTILFHEEAGMMLPSSPTPLELYLASLTQWGFIGDVGFQKLQGNFQVWSDVSSLVPIYLCGVGEINLLFFHNQPLGTDPPIGPGLNGPNIRADSNLFVMVDEVGSALFFASSPTSGAITLTAEVPGGGGTQPILTLSNTGLIGSQPSYANLYAYDFCSLGASISSSAALYFDSGAMAPATTFDLSDGSSGSTNPAFSINQQFGSSPSGVGAYGTTTDGTVVMGGIVTHVGTTPTGGPPTGSAGGSLSGTYPNPNVAALNGQPLSLPGGQSVGDVLTWNGLAWDAEPPTGGGGSPTGPAGGDLGGSYPNPTVEQLQTQPLALVGTPTLGDVLTWNGSSWDNEAPSALTPFQIIRATGFVAIDPSGGISGIPAAGQAVSFSNNATSSNISISDPGTISLVTTAGSILVGNFGGQIDLGQFHGTVSLPTSGAVLLTSTPGAIVNLDAAGNIILTLPGGLGFGIFGGGPAVQQTALGTTAGWTAGSSLNFLRTDDTFDGGLGGSAYTVGDVVLALKRYGWIAP